MSLINCRPAGLCALLNYFSLFAIMGLFVIDQGNLMLGVAKPGNCRTQRLRFGPDLLTHITILFDYIYKTNEFALKTKTCLFVM